MVTMGLLVETKGCRVAAGQWLGLAGCQWAASGAAAEAPAEGRPAAAGTAQRLAAARVCRRYPE